MTAGKVLAFLGVVLALLALVFSLVGSGPTILLVCAAVLLVGIANLIP